MNRSRHALNQTQRFAQSNAFLLERLRTEGNRHAAPGYATLLEAAVFRAEQRLRHEAEKAGRP